MAGKPKVERRPIEPGDRFESKDPREEGRIVVVRTKLSEGQRFSVETVANPNSLGSSVGRRTIVSENTLHTRWKRVSH